MVLRLSDFQQQPSSAALQTFISDPNVTAQQKLDCLKLLKVILKNLSDGTKVKDPKFRQLRLGNDKIKMKLAVFPSAVSFLACIGFSHATENNESILRIEESVAVQNATNIQSSLQEVIHGIDIMTKQQIPAINVTATKSTNMVEKLSGKQKARLLTEQKEKEEKLKDKEERSKNVAMLKQDKHVRENDPNWKSGVSAACAKSGTGISTFRDKYGE